MASQDPFKFLERTPSPEDVTEEDDNPFDFLATPTLPISSLPEPEITATERFLEGAGRGALHPIKGITGEIEAPADAGLAGTIGEFAGAGLSVLPFFKVGQAVAKGVGLTGLGARLVEGAVTGALFEAGAGPLEETPERILTGAGFGAVGEVAFAGAAALWRGKFPRWSGPKPSPIAPDPVVGVNPDALRIERMFAPTVGDELLQEKLLAIGDEAAQLDQALTKLNMIHRPGGMTVIPGVRAIEEFAPAVQRALPGARAVGHARADGLFDVLVFEEGELTRLVARAPELRSVFMGEGQPVLTFQQALDLVGEHNIDVFVRSLDEIQREFGGTVRGGEVAGFARGFNKERPEIWLGETHDDIWMLELLSHEYAHAHTRARDIRSVFSLNPETLAREDLVMTLKNIDPKTLSQGSLAREFYEATLQIVMKGRQIGRKAAETLLRKKRTSKGVSYTWWDDYFGRDTELIARLTELMFIDPAAARRVAPRATRMMSRLLQREAPKMRALFEKSETGNWYRAIDDFMNTMWIRRGEELTIFQKELFQVTPRMARQFGKQGVFNGMEGFVDGKSVEFLSFVGTGRRRSLIRHVDTGKTEVIDFGRFTRPVLPTLVRRQEEAVQALRPLLGRTPSWVAITVRENLPESPPGAVGTRAIVSLENFEQVDDISRWVRQNREAYREVVNRLESGAVSSPIQQEVAIATVLLEQGKAGLVANDGGILDIFIADPFKTMRDGDLVGNLGDIVSGSILQNRFQVSLDETMKAILREQGVPERELSQWLGIAKHELKKTALEGVDPEVRQVAANAEVAAASLSDEPAESAVRTNLEMDAEAGSVVLRQMDTQARVGRFPSEESASAYVRDLGIDESASVLDEGAELPTDAVGNGSGGSSGPPKFQEQMPLDDDDPIGFLERVGNATTLFGSMFSALENFAKRAEEIGHGPAFTKVFDPVQRILFEVDRQFASIKRGHLGDISFNEQLKKLEKLMRGIPRGERQRIIDYVEYLSKEEVAAPGGLLKRGMNENELRIAREIENFGLAHDVPRLMATGRLVRAALRSQKALSETIRQMRRVQLSDEVQGVIQRLEALPEFGSADEVFTALGVTAEEQQVIKIIQDRIRADKDNFSIMAVSRYASARPLASGYRTGREQFAAEQGLGARELAVADELDKLFEVTFGLSGMDPKREIGGYWPHMRKWAEHGWSPDLIPGMRESLPESLEWSSLRFRTGELDVYARDPLLTSYKHVRSMLMKQHFDPVLPELKESIARIKELDPRTARIMSEYVMEALGRPHASFGKLQEAIRTGAKSLGFELPEKFVEQIVNSLASLASAAAIPFRPALIARNYYQIWQMIAPRVGHKYFYRALKYAIDPETKDAAFKAAVDADAIATNRIPIEFGTELFAPGQTAFSYRTQLLFEKGFRWYQSADDLGRAVAFHAQRMRIADAAKRHFNDGLSFDDFKKAAKIKTFSRIDESQFDEMWGANQYEEAKDYLGRTLARETLFRYGHVNHPAGWGSIYGRLFGQFGTWPTQYKDFLIQGLTRGTTKDKWEFILSHGAINVGTIAGFATVGVNAWSWVSFPALNYTGGPFADVAINLVQAFGGSPTEQQLAKHNLLRLLPTLEDPRSIFLPGSYFLGDVADMIQAGSAGDAIKEGLGFRVLQPGDLHAFEWVFGS